MNVEDVVNDNHPHPKRSTNFKSFSQNFLICEACIISTIDAIMFIPVSREYSNE